MTDILLFLGGWTTGWFVLIGVGCYRAVTSDGWDDSNIMNWLRLFSFVCIHPGKFARLYRLTEADLKFLKLQTGKTPPEPFAFIRKDEFSGNFPETRA